MSNREYKLKRLPNLQHCTQAQIVRISDGKIMMDVARQLSFTKRTIKDMNNKTPFGLYMISEGEKL